VPPAHQRSASCHQDCPFAKFRHSPAAQSRVSCIRLASSILLWPTVQLAPPQPFTRRGISADSADKQSKRRLSLEEVHHRTQIGGAIFDSKYFCSPTCRSSQSSQSKSHLSLPTLSPGSCGGLYGILSRIQLTDKSCHSWVMLSDTEGFVPLPNEQRLYKSPPRTTISLQTLNKFPGREPYSVQSSAGSVHLTNRRVCV